MATTLAHALNQQHRSVLLFDAAGGLLNLNFQLGLDDHNTLGEVLDGHLTINQALTPLNKHKFHILSAPSGSNLLEDVPIGQLHLLREDLMALAQNYQYVIIDLPATEKIIKHLMPHEINLLLICTDDLSNLVSTYNFLQSNDIRDNYAELQIIVNYANSYEAGLRTYNSLRRACEQYVKKTPPLMGVIRRDTRIRDAIRNGALLLNRYPNAEASEDVVNIAGKILEQEKHHGL